MVDRYLKKSSNWYCFVLILMIAIITSTPRLGFSVYLVPLLIMTIPVIIKMLSATNKLCYTVIVYLFMVMLYAIVGISDAGLGDYMQHIFFFIPVFIMMTIPGSLSVGKQKKLWWLMVAFMALNVAINVYLSIKYPSINNINVRAMINEDVLSGLNLGGSKFFTFSLFFFAICFFVFLNSKEKIIRIATLFASVLTGVYIIWFCYKVSVIIYVIFIAILLFFSKRAKRAVRFVVIVGVTAVLGVAIVSANESAVIETIVRISPDQRVAQRFITLVDEDDADANEATVTGRTNLYMLSVKTWLSSPANFFFGIGDHRSMYNAASTGIGQHSDLLDSLARYGLIGLVLLLLFFKYAFRYLLSLFDRSVHLQLYCIFAVLIMAGLTKAIFTPAIGCVMFLLLPLSRNLIGYEQ